MEVPNKSQVTRGFFKQIDGVWCKRCTGPAHDEPVFLPATEKYFYRRKSGKKAGTWLHACRLCNNWKKLKSPGSRAGIVDPAKVRPFFEEAVNRVGRYELAKRTGLAIATINRVVDGEAEYVFKPGVRKVMLELISMQRKNEYIVTPWRQAADTARAKRKAVKDAKRLEERQEIEYKRRQLKARQGQLRLVPRDEYLAQIYPVKDANPDPTWWVDTGSGVLPRYGEEMLGSDF